MTVFITFVLDETGSMSGTRKDTIGGFNTYVQDLNKDLSDVKFSLMKFNSSYKTWVHEDEPLASIKELTEQTYAPSGGTPLWDAFGMAIERMERVAKKEEDKVIITVLTDGEENSSTQFTAEQVKALIENHPDWAVTFLGTNMDAWHDVGKAISMIRGATLSYDSNDVVGTFSIQSNATLNFAKGTTDVSNFYSQTDEETGD